MRFPAVTCRTMDAVRYAFYAALPFLAFWVYVDVCMSIARVLDVDSGKVALVGVMAFYLVCVYRLESTRRDRRH